jgi:hypothetical protein
MKQLSYYGYTVSVTAMEREGSWRSHVRITWSHGRQQIQLQDANRFTSKTEAEDYAIRLGKQWVDGRLFPWAK